MLWLIAQLVIISLPQAYPITLATLNWCAPALGLVLVALAVLWMVFLRHYITGPETGQAYAHASLKLQPVRCCSLMANTKLLSQVAPASPQMSCTSIPTHGPSIAAEFTNSDLLKTW